MDHAAHEPGTVQECPECRAFSYEPGWYKSLRQEHVSGREPLVIPDAVIEVVIPDAEHLDVVVPELEDVRREDEER